MSKFSDYRFSYKRDPIMVRRIVYLKKDTFLTVFSLSNWVEYRANVYTLFAEPNWNIMVIRCHVLASNKTKLRWSKRYEVVLEKDLYEFKFALADNFALRDTPGRRLDQIEEYIKGLPVSRRLSYQEVIIPG